MSGCLRRRAGAVRAPVFLLAFVVLACSEPAIAPIDDHPEHHELPDDEIQPLAFRTYDGSGQVVHPDIVQLPATRSGPRRVLAITPYPGGDASIENPSIFSSDYADAWRVPSGLSNP